MMTNIRCSKLNRQVLAFYATIFFSAAGAIEAREHQEGAFGSEFVDTPCRH